MSAFLDSVDADTKELLSAEFSEPCTIVFDDGVDTVTISTEGIFDKTYLEVDADTGASVMSNNPRITIYDKEIEAELYRKINDDAGENWLLTVRGTTYRIKSAEPDGIGMLIIYLKNR